MFNAQPFPVFSTPSPRPYDPAVLNPRPTEALCTMPSATNRSAAFEQLALPLFASLYNHAHWLTHNPSEAEDLVQETFTKALRAFDSFQPNTNFKAWIFRILRNTFLTTRAGIAASPPFSSRPPRHTRHRRLRPHPRTSSSASTATPPSHRARTASATTHELFSSAT
jgi:RNA polymerase sigma factor (sigma-70 family)